MRAVAEQTSEPEEPRVAAAASEQEIARPLSRLDLLGMFLGFALSLLISWVFSHKRILWEDEMLGWMLLRDPSWHHMISAWKSGADGGGFAFYLTGRLWFKIFGPSAVSLRMYSAASLGLAFVVLWSTARRFYRTSVLYFALFNTWFCSTWIVVHMAEGRFYGLLVLSTAMVAWLTMVASRKPGRTALYLYPLTFVLHALLTTAHVLGIVYSAFLLASMIALDLSARRLRPGLYLCAAAAWLLLIPELPAIRASAMVGKPHFWTTQPTVVNFVGAYIAFSSEVALILLLLTIATVLTLRRSTDSWRYVIRRAFAARRPVWIVTIALLLVPIAFLLEGFFGPPIFVNRYLIPVTLAQAFLTAEGLTLVDWRRFTPRLFQGKAWARPLGAAAFAGLILFWVFGHLKFWVIPPDNYTDALTAMLPKGVPVVCEDAWSFSEIIARQHDSGVLYTYLLDWPQAIRPDSPLLEVTQYHLMENWRKVGYFGGSIADGDGFLKKYDRFLVVRAEPNPKPDAPLGYGNPLVDRFAHTPGYEVRPYGVLHRHHFKNTVWLVCRGSCSAPSQVAVTAQQPIDRYLKF